MALGQVFLDSLKVVTFPVLLHCLAKNLCLSSRVCLQVRRTASANPHEQLAPLSIIIHLSIKPSESNSLICAARLPSPNFISTVPERASWQKRGGQESYLRQHMKSLQKRKQMRPMMTNTAITMSAMMRFLIWHLFEYEWEFGQCHDRGEGDMLNDLQTSSLQDENHPS